jgi:hypothetical protein
MAAIKDEDMTGLSDAERAAMADADDTELNALQGAGVQSFDPDDEDDPKTLPAVAATAPADPAAPAAADPAAPAAETTDPVAAVVDPIEREFVPTFNAPAVEDYDGKIAALVAEEVALRAKLSEGDIDISTYAVENTRIIEAKAELRGDQRMAEFAASQNEANNKARWQWEQERFFEQETSAIYKDPLLFAALDAAVKAAAHIPENAKRSSGWFLAQADIQVRKLFNPAAPAGAPATAPAAAAAKPVVTLVKTGPTTLASLPAAELPETGGGDEFARFEKLSGIELERQLSRLSPDEANRYLRAA